jgi:hypothetical protein
MVKRVVAHVLSFTFDQEIGGYGRIRVFTPLLLQKVQGYARIKKRSQVSGRRPYLLRYLIEGKRTLF